ncbi:MAG: FliO/MopB family protein [Candidatus Eremiobacteraeota bacterium]|nr:FliO/MopB family protein [Candidatus Eremiobacteraeota bacterium]MBC5804395.1 FliO/MopB family protein [Candidatus Eremiobacteraeota bacterium]MBC5821148.1 FliO/MopB family protein [Candidatus Eremiobacteraeota bacterium]
MIDAAELLRFLAAFTVVGLVLFALSRLSRQGSRLGPFLRRSRIVEVIETTPLPHGSALHVAKFGDTYYVIGRTDHGISLLAEVQQEVILRRDVQPR